MATFVIENNKYAFEGRTTMQSKVIIIVTDPVVCPKANHGVCLARVSYLYHT